jgi:hypothetical protein
MRLNYPEPPHLANLEKNFDREPYQMCGVEWIFFVLVFASLLICLYRIVKVFITAPPYKIVTLKQNV